MFSTLPFHGARCRPEVGSCIAPNRTFEYARTGGRAMQCNRVGFSRRPRTRTPFADTTFVREPASFFRRPYRPQSESFAFRTIQNLSQAPLGLARRNAPLIATTDQHVPSLLVVRKSLLQQQERRPRREPSQAGDPVGDVPPVDAPGPRLAPPAVVGPPEALAPPPATQPQRRAA